LVVLSSLAKLAAVFEVEERPVRAGAAPGMQADVGLGQVEHLLQRVERQRLRAGLRERAAADALVTDAEQRLERVGADLAAVLDFSPAVGGRARLLGLGRPVDAFHQRAAAELRRQQWLEHDLALRLVVGMRGAAAAADAEAARLVADVAERA